MMMDVRDLSFVHGAGKPLHKKDFTIENERFRNGVSHLVQKRVLNARLRWSFLRQRPFTLLLSSEPQSIKRPGLPTCKKIILQRQITTLEGAWFRTKLEKFFLPSKLLQICFKCHTETFFQTLQTDLSMDFLQVLVVPCYVCVPWVSCVSCVLRAFKRPHANKSIERYKFQALHELILGGLLQLRGGLLGEL